MNDEAQAVARATQGRASAIDRLHLTLAFIGNASPAQLATLESVGSTVARQAAPFMLALDCIGMFRNVGIAWAGTADTPIQLTRLVENLRDSLLLHSFRAERHPFSAHVSLARHCRQPQPARKMPAIRWQVHAITLTASHRPPLGHPEEGALPLGGKARSAKGAHDRPPLGRPKEGALPLGGKARSAKGAHDRPPLGPHYRTLAQWPLRE